MRFTSNRRVGQSILELIIYVGLASIVSIFIATVITNMYRNYEKGRLLQRLLERKNQFQYALNQESTFVATRSAAINAGMQCLRDQAVCSSTYVATGYRTDLEEITLVGTAFTHNGRSSSSAGFDEKGGACTGFSASGQGNDTCPIGYIVYWYLDRASSTIGVNLTITAKMIYNPAPGNRYRASFITSLSAPPGYYDATATKTVQSLVDLSVVSCTVGGVTVNHGGSYPFYQSASVPVGERCIEQTRLCTTYNNVASLSGSFTFASCVQNCAGVWEACSVPCGGGTQAYSHTVPANAWGAACAIANGTTQACNIAACATNINGVCGGTNNSCTAGTLQDTADGGGFYNWRCLGSGTGTDANCTLAIVPVNGSCGVNADQCITGIFSDTPDTSTFYEWDCLGTGGGSNISCAKAIPPPSCAAYINYTYKQPPNFCSGIGPGWTQSYQGCDGGYWTVGDPSCFDCPGWLAVDPGWDRCIWWKTTCCPP